MFRSKIANGVVKRGKYGGPQPPAADMEQMVMLRNLQNHVSSQSCLFIQVAT